MQQPRDSRKVHNARHQTAERVIVRTAVLSRSMIDGMRHDSTSCPHDQRREESMHVIEMRQGHERLATEHFDPAAAVRRVVVQNSTTNTVGQS